MFKLLQTSRGKYRIYRCLTNIFVTEQSLNYDIYLFEVVQYGNADVKQWKKNTHNLNNTNKIVATNDYELLILYSVTKCLM